MLSEEVMKAYCDKFECGIPVGPWHGEAIAKRAEAEAWKAIKGERGPLMSSEFPLECPPGAIL